MSRDSVFVMDQTATMLQIACKLNHGFIRHTVKWYRAANVRLSRQHDVSGVIIRRIQHLHNTSS